jgi:uncharacterized protein (TIGR03435 family)
MIRPIACLLVCMAGIIHGQTAAAPRFEVASIRPANPAPGFSSGIKTGHGRLTADNVTLKRCIIGAYGVGPNQVVGGPDWLDTDRFEIAAKADQPVGDHALMAMLQSLLAERFKLALHRETRQIHAYVVEVAKSGPKLEKGDGKGSTTQNGRGLIDAANISMDAFAQVLSRQMDLPVVNHTNLEGVFNLKLQWTPESVQLSKAAAGGTAEGPSIFTAIQEQLGLRLRAEKAPVEVLVIDHAERPGGN